MSEDEGFWVGADPGGKGNFGIAVLEDARVIGTRCVDCAEEAVEAVEEMSGVRPSGVGVDAPMWWSSGLSGLRLADKWLRDKYSLTSGQVQAVNSLRGAALAQGVMFVQRMRESFPDICVTETHPKALLVALSADEEAFYRRYRVSHDSKTASAGIASEHERDAVISAVAAREGFSGRWQRDLSLERYPEEQDPSSHHLSPVHYFWPDES